MIRLVCRPRPWSFGYTPKLCSTWSCLAAGVVLFGVGTAWSQPAAAPQQQITPQVLIGDAVSGDIGTRYGDVDKAITFFKNGDVINARTLLELAKQKDPGLPPIDLIMAKMYFIGGNVPAGRASIEKTAMENPNDPEVYLILAEQAVSPQQNRLIEAESLYDKAATLIDKFNENPKRKRNFQIRLRAGRPNVFERRRNWAAAAGDLAQWVKIDPENPVAHFRYGRALFMQKKTKEGFAELDAAEKLDKDKNLPHPPWVSAALMFDQLGMKSEAQKAFDNALRLNSTNPATLIAYGQWLIKTGSLDKAEQVLAEARKSNPQNVNLLILSGVAARMSKKMKPAEDYFVDALRISPANGDTINQLALLLIEQNDKEKRQRALEFAALSARFNNQSADAQVTFAWILYQLGSVAEAQQALQQGLQLGNLSPDSNYLVARILVDQKPPRSDAARRILQGTLDAEVPGIFVYRSDAQQLLKSLAAQ